MLKLGDVNKNCIPNSFQAASGATDSSQRKITGWHGLRAATSSRAVLLTCAGCFRAAGIRVEVWKPSSGLLGLWKSISLVCLGDYSSLLGRSGAQGGDWRRFNPRDKRKPSKRLIAGLCILSGAAAHVTAAMPSARTARWPA